MPLFEINNSKSKDKSIIDKLNKKKETPIKKSNLLIDKIHDIEVAVNNNLGHLKDQYRIITSEEELKNYIQAANENNILSIDTETTGLNPLIDSIVGLCLYTPGEKGAYVPINHIDYITEKRIPNQLTSEQVRDVLNMVTADIYMFNATFDIRVLRHQVGSYLTCYWDAYIAARLMNENEESNGLKALHEKYILKGEDKEFSFSALFKGITADKIPVDIFYMYAAHDAVITYELCEFQKKFLNPMGKNGMNEVYNVFMDIEMPIVEVVCDMEDQGFRLDFDYIAKLTPKYHKLAEEKLSQCYEEINKYADKIDEYNQRHGENSKLSNPINLSSPSQLAILFYDIMGLPPIDPKSPRGTGEAILKKMDIPLTKLLLEYRAAIKLTSTYLDKMPEIALSDGKVHCRFNQVHAQTGRFSSDSPNLQNIPSKNKEIRKMFIADPGYVLMSSDYSQQEIKVMAEMCKDPFMKKTFEEGKDFYAQIASASFNRKYEDCLEHFPKGSHIKMNEDGKSWRYATRDEIEQDLYDKLADGDKDTFDEGKKYRSQAKAILLGILYGKGEKTIADELKCTKEEARAIKQSVFENFPAIKQFEYDSLQMARTKGYVTTLWGRKRRLPDINLPPYEFKSKDGSTLSLYKVEKYTKLLKKCKYRNEVDKVSNEAIKEGVVIINNSSKIAQAERQTVNARIQGSAADMSKKALIAIHRNQRLKELGANIIVPIHDEIIIQCPLENAKEVEKIFVEMMENCAKDKFTMDIKCDVTVSKEWYGPEIELT